MGKATHYKRDSFPRVDWFRVMSDCRRAGYCLAAVAREVGIPRSTLQHWCHPDKGAQAGFEHGLRVVAFWQHATGRTIESLPWVSRFAPYPQLGALSTSPGFRHS